MDVSRVLGLGLVVLLIGLTWPLRYSSAQEMADLTGDPTYFHAKPHGGGFKEGDVFRHVMPFFGGFIGGRCWLTGNRWSE